MRSKLSLCALTLILALPILAQNAGTIAGVVTDQQDAVLPNAKVSLSNAAQGGVVRELTTNQEGAFVITPLLPGTYSLTVEAPGFKTVTRTGIVVNLNDRIGVD